MTIQEVERRSGLDRANIRFYEKEGLLTPERKANGYRDYSEDDLQLLLKIKLLRRLDFSLDAIRSLKEGNTDLEAALARRLEGIGAQRRELNATEQVCREMRQDGAVFPTLDAEHYLRSYDSALRIPATAAIRPTVPESDRIQPPRIPWRRYFARLLDVSLIRMLFRAVLAVVFRVNLANIPDFVDWLLTYVEWAMLIPLEALLLSRFGTTPGKWIMGIRVEHADGRLLPFSHAAQRAWEVFGRGYGYNIPFYEIYRLWRSYKDAKEGDGPEWDYNVTLVAREYHWGRTAAYIAATVLAVLLGVAAAFVPYLPYANRGADLTAEAFVENYNQLAKFHGAGMHLEDLGGGKAAVEEENGERVLVLELTEEDGVLTEIAYQREYTVFYWGSSPDAEGKQTLLLSFMAYAWADTGLGKALPSQKELEPFTALQDGTLKAEILGCELTYTITPRGEKPAEGGAWMEETYAASFSMCRVP